MKRFRLNLIFLSLLLFRTLFIAGQELISYPEIATMKGIEKKPSLMEVSNKLEINNSGGHLQGIQLVNTNSGKHAVLTGSSDSYSYLLVIKLQEMNKVILLNKLMDKPFRHAGGFQIYNNIMAVGIEDNSAKDKSKICLYELTEPEKPLGKPLAIIERFGEPYRSTAGCVGITRFKDQVLIAAGDWDTKHIDFYSCNAENFRNGNFKLTFSIGTDTLSRLGWIEANWYPYQNINLFNFNERLFLLGFGQNKKNENIADLFSLEETSPGKFNLKKIEEETFRCEKGPDFKAGAGAELSVTGKINIISCGYNIENQTFLNFFRNK